MKENNSKILLCDFILDCQIIEEFLKKLILIFSNDFKRKDLEKHTLGMLILKFKEYTTDQSIINNLTDLKDKRNKLIHDTALKLMQKIEKLKIKEIKKDKILNDELNNEINEAQKLNNKCFEDLIGLLKKDS